MHALVRMTPKMLFITTDNIFLIYTNWESSGTEVKAYVSGSEEPDSSLL